MESGKLLPVPGGNANTRELIRLQGSSLCCRLCADTFPEAARVHLAVIFLQAVFISSLPHIKEYLVPCHIRENKKVSVLTGTSYRDPQPQLGYREDVASVQV